MQIDKHEVLYYLTFSLFSSDIVLNFNKLKIETCLFHIHQGKNFQIADAFL